MQSVQRLPNFGDIISTSFQVWTKNLATYVPITLLLAIPRMLAVTAIRPPIGESLGTLIGLVTDAMAAGFLTFAVFSHLTGKRPGLPEIVSVGLARMGSVIGVSLCVAAPMVLTALGTLLITPLLGLLIIPAFILFIMWSVAVCVCVVERSAVGLCISRSATLTAGFRWQTFALLLVIGLIVAVPASIPALLLRGSPVLGAILATTIGGVLASLHGVAVVVLYRELRIAKEGLDANTLANVF